MNVYEVDPLQDPRWNELVESHPRGSVFHSPRWLEALRNTYGYDPVVISTCPPTETLANGLVFSRVKSWLTGDRLVSVPFSDHCDSLVNSENELDHLLLSIRCEVDKGNWKYVEIRPTFLEPGTHTKLEKSVTYYLHRVDLRKSTQELFRGFHKDCVQRKIRRAERECLNYEEGGSEALLQDFYRLLVMTRKRQHLPPQPLAWFRQLMAAFGGHLTIRVASKNSVPIASILTLTHKKTMTYKYGCSDAQYHKLGGTALLFWKAIQEAKMAECVAFDLGRSDIHNQGLITFKEHWGASRSVMNYWRYPHKPSGAASAWTTRLVNKVVSISPDFSLVAVGRLLYPHIG